MISDVFNSIDAPDAMLFVLGLALLIALLRLVRGPELPDRVIALEVISMISVGVIITFAIDANQRAFLDVALVMALVTFLGTVAFARYLEKGGHL